MDGKFDQMWKCVRSARGRFTRLYIDWVRDADAPGGAGGWLVMLNDWLVNDQGEVPASCYNRFSVTTGGGSERWRIRVYGDQTIWVEKNGVVVQERGQSSIANGAVGFGTSPNGRNFNHTIFELKFPASTGIFSTRLGDPVRYVSSLSSGTTCVMEDDPVEFTTLVADAPSDRRRGPLVTTACTAADPADCAFFDPCAPPRRHVLDGSFDATWSCVTPVRGRYTWAYFDYVADETSPTGGWLYILNDWVAMTGAIPSTCFNLFTATTGGGAERWVIKVYGDASVWVSLNDEVVQERMAMGDTGGAAGFGSSPNMEEPHTIYARRSLIQIECSTFPQLPYLCSFLRSDLRSLDRSYGSRRVPASS